VISKDSCWPGRLGADSDDENKWRSAGYISLLGRMPTTLQRASILLQQGEPSSSFLELKRVPTSLFRARVGPKTVQLKRKKTEDCMGCPDQEATRSRSHSPNFEGSRISRRGCWPSIPTGMRYTRKVRRLLYMAEFLLLINYVDVVIPLVFCTHPALPR
jgi:hypothetical protein